MNTKRSKLELFTLKSSVSELSETEKETALKVVGGEAGCACSTGYALGTEDESGNCIPDPDWNPSQLGTGYDDDDDNDNGCS